ncbi:sigma factor G inhibitor Gin [Dehalobacter sp. DCM]|uniref:sigma factor G inhibitor Gin n=1 Tax=Dehalobacter sp. DCM TaxID=2907827 RepID=UPI0030812A80|nr:sigma factor G inhibitor Gin [Dehalobacter sp. DCM]
MYPKCAVCGQVPAKGLFDGLWLAGKLICTDCEQKIIVTDVQEHRYHDHIRDIRHILFGSVRII